MDGEPGEPGQSGAEPDYMGLITSTGDFSAYPPIADYGFLSDCEVTALVAPSGAIEWMCLPRMDCPSVFGAILDRRAGSFRFGPENVDVPADRRYLPGTMVLETSWDCGEGWIVVRDCLVMGEWRHEHPEPYPRTSGRRPTTTPSTYCCGRCAACRASVQLALDCEPVFDYGLQRARWTPYRVGLSPGGRHCGRQPAGHPHLRHPVRHRGVRPPAGRTPAARGRHPVLRAVLGQADPAEDLQGGRQAPAVDGPPLAALAGPGQLPRPPLAQPSHQERADAQGPGVRPDRRHRRGGHHVPAGNPARGAELGLPLQLDP